MSSVMSYEEFKQSRIKYDGITKCFVGDCDKPAFWEGGDERYWCGMCEEHSHLRASYRLYLHCILREANERLTGEELYEKAKAKEKYWQDRIAEEMEKQYGREFGET